MTTKKKRLGRGLDALLSNSGGDSMLADQATETLRSLPVDMLTRGQYQPRTRMDEESLRDLAASIKAQGIIQPILVRRAGDAYEIVAGERRWRAAQLAELSEVPVVVRDIPDEATLAVALIENIQRENLNPIEEASGLRRLLDEFGLTHQQAADAVGRSRVAVTNLLRLLSLSAGAKDLLEQGNIEMGHARALLSLPEKMQDSAAREVYARQLSVRQTETLVRERVRQPSGAKKESRKKDADVRRLEEGLSEKLGARVSIQDKGGKGRLVIDYHSLDELDGIIERIK